jgi:hypothetical protein
MASMKAKIEIGLDTSKIKSGSKEATQSFDKIASGAKSALGKVDARADKAGNKIKQVGNEGKIAGSKVKQGAEKGAQGMNKLGNEAKKAERDIGGVAISVLGLGASVTGLSDTIFGMKEKLVALERSSFGLERTTEDMKRMQEDFDEAVKTGTMTAKEHQRALKDLELGYKDMAVEVKEIEAETEAMNSEWISFAVNTATTVVFSLTTITTALGAERVAKIGSALATNLATLANRKFVMSLWAIAKHPVFLIATAGLAIWESNLFGLRSEIEKWSGMDDLSLLSNLEKTFSSGIPDAGAETIDSLDEIEKKAEKLQESFDETTTQSNKGIIPMIEDVGDCSVKSARKVDTLTNSIDNLKKKQQTFRLDFVADEKQFQDRVANLAKQNIRYGSTDSARRSGLSSLVNFSNMLGGNLRDSKLFGHGMTSVFTDPMDHWNGGMKWKIGGNEAQNYQERHDQQMYNASISGFDNNSKKGWSSKALKTQSLFQQRIARKNAIASAKHHAQKLRAKQGRINQFNYFARWGLASQFRGTKNWKPIWRGLGGIINRHRKRREFLSKAGFDTSSPASLANAELEWAIAMPKWIEDTGFDKTQIKKYVADDRRSDIFNVIDHRRRTGMIEPLAPVSIRLGLISSGVI